MDYREALDKLKSLEGDSELASVLEAHIGRLDEKNYSLIGEKRSATNKAQAYEPVLKAVGQALGLTGDTDAILSEIDGKVRLLATENSQLKEEKQSLESQKVEAETKVRSLERAQKLTEITTKAGVNPSVFDRILGDKLNEMTIDGSGVKVGDKDLREFVEADESLKPFIPALFQSEATAHSAAASSNSTSASSPKLPSGSPKGTTSPDTAAAAYERATGRSSNSDFSWIGKKNAE